MKLFALVFASLLFTNIAVAGCEEPQEPALPNVADAVTAQMVKAQNDVKDYIKSAEKFIGCTRNELAQRRMTKKIETIAEDFNSLVRAYKERMQKA
ncbi:hypothetical protein [Aurantivibrio plasticivorans]